MAESLIPGLDGALPSEREHVSDPLRLKQKANGETMSYGAPRDVGEANSRPRHQVSYNVGVRRRANLKLYKCPREGMVVPI